MNVLNLFISMENTEKPYTSADVRIDGVGVIPIRDCLSKETCEAALTEVEEHIKSIFRKENNNEDRNT